MRDNSRMRIGNQTAWSASTPMEPFEYAVSHGFDAFEWFPDRRADGRGWLETDLPAATRQWILRLARAHDISLSVHSAWDATPLTSAGRDRLASQAEFAVEIGARLFVTHLVPFGDVDSFVDAMDPFAAGLARDGIRLAIENTPDSSPSNVNQVFRRFRHRAASREAGLCLDVGHANLSPETRNDYLAFVDRLAPEAAIVHVHLHENWGDEDTHLTLFTGPAAADAAGIEGLMLRLRRRRFAGCIILEQWPQHPALLDGARARLVRIATSASGTI